MKEKSLFTIDAKIWAYDKGVKHASQEDVEVCCQDFHSYENAYACRKHCE